MISALSTLLRFCRLVVGVDGRLTGTFHCVTWLVQVCEEELAHET